MTGNQQKWHRHAHGQKRLQGGLHEQAAPAGSTLPHSHTHSYIATNPHLALVREGAAAGVKCDAGGDEAGGHHVARLRGEVGEDVHVGGGVHAARHTALCGWGQGGGWN